MSFNVLFATDMDDEAMDYIEKHRPAFEGSTYTITDGNLTIRNDEGRTVIFAARTWLAVIDD
ncbi:hypothetical protein [Mycolicibacterium pulveris]|uniref:hypothetical protein n=1 Tax=Mycolicibacterium pulveris TaxID=36813 RepID=UPI003CF733AB